MPGQKRARYDAVFKLHVIKRAKLTSNIQAARHYGIPERNVFLWRKNEEQLQKIPKISKRMPKINFKRAKHTAKEGKFADLEKYLKKWCEDQKRQLQRVTYYSLRAEAMRRSLEMYGNNYHFKASLCWCYHFTRRNGLVPPRMKMKLFELKQKLTDFQLFVSQQRLEHNFDLACIANMDEIPMQFDMLSGQTVESKGANTVQAGTTVHEKESFLVVLTCMANGYKLKPMIIFERKSMPEGKFPQGVVVHVHDRGWMNHRGMDLWFKEVWNRKPGGLLGKKCLLVWDSFRAHLTDYVKCHLAHHNTIPAVIPGGLTGIVQPLDVSLKPFKAEIKKKWHSWMARDNADSTPSGSLKGADPVTIATWVKEAWESVPPEMVIKSFQKTGISKSLDDEKDGDFNKDFNEQAGADEAAADDDNVGDEVDWHEDQWHGTASDREALANLSDTSDSEGF